MTGQTDHIWHFNKNQEVPFIEDDHMVEALASDRSPQNSGLTGVYT
jgi:hypothetical protein